MNTSNANDELVRLREAADGDRKFLIHPEDDDIFMRTGKQVIEACRLGIGFEVWVDEVNSMIEYVRDWALQHSDKLAGCYISPRGSNVGLYFIPRSESFDFDLADLLAPLNRDLMKQFNVGMIEINQIPSGELDRFTRPDARRAILPHERITHQSVEA